MRLMFHDDSCGELLNAEGFCPKCGFHPDMQSTGFKEVPDAQVAADRKFGRTFLGPGRERVE